MSSAALDAPASSKPVRSAHFRTLIALTMLLIASLGAGIAGWAAIKQQSSSNLERRVAQAQMMELADWLKLIEVSRSAKAMQERLDRHLTDARMHRELAGQERTDDPARARLRELEAQEALLLANVVRPFVEFLPNIIAEDLTLDERRMGLVAAGSLQRRGFEASWVEGRQSDGVAGASAAQPQMARIRLQEKERMEAFDQQVLQLSLIVVALVVALVLLTFADLAGGRRASSYLCYTAAIACAATSMWLALSIDADLIPTAGGVTGGFALFILLAYALGWLRSTSATGELLQPQGIDTQGFAGSQLQIQEAAHAFSRFLIVAIALAALVSAIIGYWYSAASIGGGDAAQAAYLQQLEVVKRSSRASTAVLGTFEALVDLYERRVRCQSARDQAELARDGRITLGERTAAAQARLDCDAFDAAARKADSQGQSLQGLDQRFGPHADAGFPLRLQQHVVGAAAGASAEEALALWDGYGELTAFWNAKTTSFLACLTIAAIALYVFGQALSMVQLRVTRAMAASGVAMVLGALGWSGVTWLKPFPTGSSLAVAACPVPRDLDRPSAAWPPEAWMKAAAHNFAIGAHRLLAADSEADFTAAIPALECAVAARPNLALAHHELAGAKALSQSTHKGQSYYSLPTKERLEEIERNARSAVDIQQRLGASPNSYALNAHAVALWGLGIRDGKLASIASALALVDKAVVLAEGLEADRRKVSADAAHNLYPWLSVLPLLYLNQSLFLIANDRIEDGRRAAERALALGSHRDWSLAGTMVTATALLHGNCDRLHPAERCTAIRAALDAYKIALISGAWRPADVAGAETPAAATRAQAAIATASPAKVSLALRIPDFDPAKDRLAVIWSATNPQWNVPDALTAITPPVAATELRVVKDRGVVYQRGILPATSFKRCLGPGQYAAEVLLNGRIAATATAEIKGPAMTATRLDTLNLALCHPATWKPWRPDGDAAWMLEPASGFANARGEPAAFLFSFAAPAEASEATPAPTDYAIERALRLLSSHHVLTGSTAELKGRLQSCDQAADGGIAVGTVRAASGLIHVALLLTGALDGAAACDVMHSVTVMQSPPG